MGEKKGERVVKSACRMCHGICGVLVHMREGRVVKVTGDPDCPTSNGYICAKGKASVELLYHPDRLQFPLKPLTKPFNQGAVQKTIGGDGERATAIHRPGQTSRRPKVRG